DNFAEKTCCTVILDTNINIGEALISKGLATVVKYRPDDDARASAYDSFLAAESKAQKSNKGIHSDNKDAGIVRIVDLSTDQSKAKQYLPFLLRNQSARKEASVEFVFPSSSKLKLFVPKENCLLNLILVGISSPKNNELIGSEAHNFVKQRIHQKDVQMSIEAIDKVGNFIGWLYFEHNNTQHNLAVELIRNGYASVRDINKSNELNAAEAEAKRQKLGVWKDYKEEEHNEALEEAITEELNEKESSDLAHRKKVIVTNISSGLSSFHAQYVDDGPKLEELGLSSFHAQYVDDGPKLEELLTELREELTANPPLPGAYKPSKGDLVVAKFSVDQLWYRAKIEKIVSNNEIQVLYVDYGNRETVNSRNIAAMPSSKFSGPSPAAKEYALAFVRLDTDPDFVDEVRNAFSDETADRVLLLKSEYKDASGLEAVTLVDEETKKDIVLQLVSDGLFFVDFNAGQRSNRVANIAQILDKEAVRKRWIEANGKEPTTEDVQRMHDNFIPQVLSSLTKYSNVIEGVADVVKRLKRAPFSLKIGSTTGYPKEVLKILLQASSTQGFIPDASVCLEEVPEANPSQPSPAPLWLCAIRLGLSPIEFKVDDSVNGIAEGLLAGVWTVGIAKTSSYVGLNEQQLDELKSAELRMRLQRAYDALSGSGAHYVIDTIADLPVVIDDINRRLANGEKP
ncbi:unnamed protein product, partial [Oppiella nova]